MSDKMMVGIFCNGRTKLLYELPKPVKSDRKGNRTADYSHDEWILKIAEKTLDAKTEVALIEQKHKYDSLAREVAEIITACTSYLEVLGYNEEARADLFHEINETNRMLGYLED